MPRTLVVVALALLAACGGARPAEQAAPAAPSRPLAGLAGQRVLVAPLFVIREGDALGWAAQIPRQAEFRRTIEEEIAFALRDRGAGTTWVMPEQLVRYYQRNPTTSPDPGALAAGPLRAASLQPGARLTEPLASQLRTLVALHDARLVLLPVELSFEPAGGTMGRASLRLVLADARTSDVRWVGQVKSDSSATFSRALPASLAIRLADLVAAP
ncbi:MAG TPA: hypothetical protein VGD77_02060 [Gemmatimonadaceae bacterium]|jgi:hypothetical protein